MKEERHSGTADRKKRVQRLKKIIVMSILTGIFTPWVLCMVLFLQNRRDERSINELKKQIADLRGILEEQSGRIEQLGTSGREQAEALVELMQKDASPSGENIVVEESVAAKEADEPKIPEEETTEANHRVYLTFDDGPSIYTNEILDILDRYGVKATFFVQGKESESDRQALVRIVEEGHTLGMHSYSHRYSEIYKSREAFEADLDRLREYLLQVTGEEVWLYRFPGGSSNNVTDVDIHEFIDCLEERGIIYYDWNVASGDAAQTPLAADTIRKNCTEGITGRKDSVILLHDAQGRATTVEALPGIIESIMAMEDTRILPITKDCDPVQHVKAAKDRD